MKMKKCLESQSLFYWIIYSYNVSKVNKSYFKGLSQSLFYWIIYSYLMGNDGYCQVWKGSQSLFYWIIYSYIVNTYGKRLNGAVSILILLDYLFL